MTLPNFLVAGAPRSGTTSLFRWLGGHPGVFMAPVKELRFFDRRFDRGMAWYERQFAGADAEAAVGEASPSYLSHDLALRRAAELLPSVRFVVSLRNPVDRAWSEYHRRRNAGTETRSFREALDREEHERRKGHRLGAWALLERGCYRPQLERASELVGPSRLHVILFDELVDQPTEVYLGVCRFLGVAEVLPRNVGSVVNAHTRFWSPRIHRRHGKLPAPARRVVGRLNARPTALAPMDPDVRRRLVDRLRSDIEDVAEWLDRDLSAWLE